MNQGLIMTLTALAVPILVLFLRLLARERPAAEEPEGVAVFTGDPDDCQHCIDLLADAGIVAWTQSEPDRSGQRTVAVDSGQAEDIPHLLPQQRQHQGLRIPTPHLG